VTYDELVAIARRFEGQTLDTVTGRRFKVGISPAGAARTTAPGR
jgi:hypothetical protein